MLLLMLARVILTESSSLDTGNWTTGGVVDITAKYPLCEISPEYSKDDVLHVLELNCRRVNQADMDLNGQQENQFWHFFLSHAREDDQLGNWKYRLNGAAEQCKLAGALVGQGKYMEAARIAVNAWGSNIMNGNECCPLSNAPFCVNTTWSVSSLVLLMLLSLPVLLFVGTAVRSTYEERKETRETMSRGTTPKSSSSGPSASSKSSSQRGFRVTAELEDLWLRKHCLRVLPSAPTFARSTASLFAALGDGFDFQEDSVKNQFEHLLSLWRSHVGTVSDRYIETGDEVDERDLLREALGDLHSELMEGFLLWREKLHLCESTMLERESSELGTMAGVRYQQLADRETLAQLADISMYLLVWGEAGNVRFMPEVIYFITELALSAGHAGHAGLYSRSAAQGNKFLTEVIRPIYNTVSEEWYESFGVNEGNNRDTKKLHAGFEAYLPKDVANYDDWNELFCDPDRLVDALELRDGSKLFDYPHKQRFQKLAFVDWESSLRSSQSKTHREIHSLWGFFASSHRIWTIHILMFFGALIFVVGDPPPAPDGHMHVMGNSVAVRVAALGMLVSMLGFAVLFSRWHVMGHSLRKQRHSCLCLSGVLLRTVLILSPAATYAGVRLEEYRLSLLDATMRPLEDESWLQTLLWVHAGVSFLAAGLLLIVPDFGYDTLWKMTPAAAHRRLLRYFFWTAVLVVKFCLSVVAMREMWKACVGLKVIMPGQHSYYELMRIGRDSTWGGSVLYAMTMWLCMFVLFVADTQFWFVLGCAVLGTATMLVQRRCKIFDLACGDAVAQIPRRFSEKVLTFSENAFSEKVWDRIVAYMHYEDKVSEEERNELSFDSTELPEAFEEKNVCHRTLSTYFPSGHCGLPKLHQSPDLQWRLQALARGLGLEMPRPFLAPHMPGLTVLIPHYMETIIMEKKELYDSAAKDIVPLMDWLEKRYHGEFKNFTRRCQKKGQFPAVGTSWDGYSPEHWDKISVWASMRMQTLYRTVAGMCLYHPALQTLWEAHGDKACSLGRSEVWDPSSSFTCLVSMQMYKFFPQKMYDDTNRMFRKFPDCLKVAFIDYDEKGFNGEEDNINENQPRRYYSCLIDGKCSPLPGGKPGEKKPSYKIELPGFPVLGDGKGDNQNHAIIFTRGTLQQCIDANQGAYFEQMLLMPTALAEFRTARRGDAGSKKIVGFPEHITSDIGSIGEFAASAEVAFGTILQRSYAVLGGRMHYGHPDLMNKQYMMQQGGVSKATKTLNLSEDIFAGMDFTLRGKGREIKHCEYFHLAKGRDLGFNTVLGFFSKISSGAGEQIITRQMFRLLQLLPLPEALTFWYAHVGYYVTQWFVSQGMPIIVSLWLFVLTSSCETTFKAFAICDSQSSAAEVMAKLLSSWFSVLIWFFLLASNLPLLMQVWYERNLKIAASKLIMSLLTLSPILFIFQAKVIGSYFANELRYGGATYVATGRGLPTERRPFVGHLESGRLEKKKVGGLFLDYAVIAYYDGFTLLVAAIFVRICGGVTDAGIYGERFDKLFFFWLALGLTIASWCFGPFLFNPYQFVYKHYVQDLKATAAFFLQDRGALWMDWYTTTQLNAHKSQRKFANYILDVQILGDFFFFAAWFCVMNSKMHTLSNLWSDSTYMRLLSLLVFVPPVMSTSIWCLVMAAFEKRRGREAESSSEDEDFCGEGLPLMLSSVCVTILAVAEGGGVLLPLFLMGWFRTFIAGVILKFFALKAVIFLGESVLRSRYSSKIGCFCRPVELFVMSHQMARDVLTTSGILTMMLPAVAFNSLNEMVCPFCNVHQLLIYRDPGHQHQEDKSVSFTHESDDLEQQPLMSGPGPQMNMLTKSMPAQRQVLRPNPGVLPASASHISYYRPVNA